MKEIFLTLFLAVICFSGLQAQKKTKLYVEAGASYSTFQNTEYSDVIYSGFGSKYGLGYLRESPKSIWGVNLQFMITNEKPSTHSSGDAITKNLTLQALYLRKIKDRLYVGITWDVLDIYSKDFDGLRNNKTSDIVGSTLWASGVYSYKKIRFGLDLGLVSYFMETPGFAYNTSQIILENGDFDYQNDVLNNRFDLKYYQLKTIPNHFQVRTNIRYQVSNRFSVAYQWHLRKFQETKHYPSTYGIHSLSVRFNIINKSK